MEIVVKNADNKVLEMLESLKATKQDLEIECYEEARLSEADEARLQETLRLRKEGKLKYHTFEESSALMDKHLRQLGADI